MDGTTKLKGRRGSPGVASGPAVVLQDMGAGSSLQGRMKEGAVLIAPLTNPSLVVYMRLAAAIVTNTGAYHSHAAKIAREFGIPCVVGVANATQLIPDGTQVTVDGDSEDVTF